MAKPNKVIFLCNQATGLKSVENSYSMVVF